jgi:hypothetical protein
MRVADFTLKTKRLLASRVGYVCSNPDCRAPTSGPCLEANKTVNAGDAAHITAASQNGPRFDPSLSAEQRRGYENGIWLCVLHARIVDQEDSRHSVELLRRWKSQAEAHATEALGRPQRLSISPGPDVTRFARLAKAILAALRTYNQESTMLGIEGPVAEMASAAKSLRIAAPVEIQTLPYPKGVVPHNPFLQERLEGSCTIRFPDGSEESGKAAHASGLELLIESRDTAIVALEQWLLLLEDYDRDSATSVEPDGAANAALPHR